MNNNTPPSDPPSDRVFFAEQFASYVDSLRQQGYRIELVEAPPVHSLSGLSIQLRCPENQIYKTVCLMYTDTDGKQQLVAVVVPATRQANTEVIKQALSITAKLRLASRELIGERTGFVPGGIPPIAFDAQWCIDTSVFAHSYIVAGGGNNTNQYTKMDPNILRMDHPQRYEGAFAH